MARQSALEAKRLLHEGVDPSENKKERAREAQRAAASPFETVAREWHTVMRPKWTERHADDVIESLEKDIFPLFGKTQVTELKAPEILDAIRKIEKRGAIDIAQRVRQRCAAVFAFAIGSGLAEHNPVVAMKGVFATRRKEPRKMLPQAELPTFLQRLNAYSGDRTVKIALRLIILTMVRTVELRGARWQEFDFTRNVWSIPAERMKMRAPHLVFPFVSRSCWPLKRRPLVEPPSFTTNAASNLSSCNTYRTPPGAGSSQTASLRSFSTR